MWTLLAFWRSLLIYPIVFKYVLHLKSIYLQTSVAILEYLGKAQQKIRTIKLNFYFITMNVQLKVTAKSYQ